jgi:hypothetical protein
VTIGNGVTSIGNNAFSGNNLTSVAIGSGVALDENAIEYSFVDYYNNNGKKAGGYTYTDRTWTYAER